MKEVDELVEQVELTDEDVKLAMSDTKNRWLHSLGKKTTFESDCIEEIISINRFGQLHKILSNPDLAFIYRRLEDCLVCQGMGMYPANVAEDKKCPGCEGSGKEEVSSVISLADVLKEKQ